MERQSEVSYGQEMLEDVDGDQKLRPADFLVLLDTLDIVWDM